MDQPATGKQFPFDIARPMFWLNAKGQLIAGNDAFQRRLKLPADPARWAESCSELLALPADVLEGQVRSIERAIQIGEAEEWIDVLFAPSGGDGGETVILGLFLEAGTAPRSLRSRDSLASSALQAARREHSSEYTFDLLPAHSPIMQRVVEQLKLAAGSDAPVCLVGETGTGKRMMARLIHHARHADRGSFVRLDCRSLTPEQQRDELIGKVDPRHPNSPKSVGLLRAPGPGTLSLEGPASLADDLQAEIVKAMPRWRRSGWRLVASERFDLQKGRLNGRLSDPFHQLLQTLTIAVPPLRERLDELEHYVELERRRCEQATGSSFRLDEKVWPILRAHDWPGNLAELHSMLEQARERAAGGTIEVAHLPRRLRETEIQTPVDRRRPLPTLRSVLDDVERRLLALALRRFKGNRSRSAAALGLTPARFAKRCREHQLDPSEFRRPLPS